jgi:glycosyltransferase involved in cell wall biosynthesis
MRFILLTQYFPPETGAPQNRLSDLAQRLVKMGHSVQVLTAKPNYPRGFFYPGYEKDLWKQANQGGVEITYCWLYPTPKKQIIYRLLNYFSFVLSSALIGSFVLSKADILIVESPPLFLSVTAWWLSRIKGARMVLNVSDLYPETAIALGMLQNPWLQKIFFCFEAWSYSVSALVTGQTEGIVKSIRNRFPNKTVYLLTNGIDVDLFSSLNDPSYRVKDHSHEKFIVGYAGILGYAQGLNSVIEAANLLRDAEDIQFHFYGDGPLRESISNRGDELRLTNVHFMGHCSHTEIIHVMQTWDVGLVPLANAPLMAGARPSKMFELMGAGLPILLSAPQGEASKIISDANAGIWVEAESPKALANAILDLRSDRSRSRQIGKNGQNFVNRYYDRNVIVEQFISFMRQKGIMNE